MTFIVLIDISAQTAPVVATDGYSPVVSATDVDYSTIDLTLTFDQNIKEGTTGGWLQIYRYNDNVRLSRYWIELNNSDSEVSISGADLIITDPTIPYLQGTQYYITIAATTIQSNDNDLYFAGITNKDTWYFTTQFATPIVITDGYTPASGATDVDVTTNLQLEFDQDIQFNSTASEYTIALYLDGNPFPIETFNFISGSTDKPSQVSIQNNNQLIINPANDLDYSSTYYITVEAGAIENTSSIPFSGFSDANTWRFSTISQPISISSYLPIQDASDIDVTTNLELTFNQDIQFNSTGTIKTIKLFEEGNVFAIETFQFVSGITDRDSEVSIQNNNQLIINMTDDLTPSTTYYITIEDGALENTSNIAFSGFSDANTWRFTTASQAPVVITDGYTPASDATDVDVTTNLQLEFDQDIQFNSTASEYTIALYINGNPFPIETFNFISGSTDKPSQVSIQNNNQLIINPANDLDYSSTYYITVEAGAIENTSSIPFSGFSDTNTWRFSTISQPISISSYLPIQDASDIDVTTNLELTFNQDIQFNSTGTIKTIKLFEEGNVFAIETFQFVSGITDRGSEVSIQNNNQLIINMTDDLSPSTTYYITIENGALENTSNIAFSGFSDPNTWRFTTASQAPVVITDGYTPASGATDVDVTTNLQLEFDQDIQFNSTASEYTIALYLDGNPFPIETFNFISGSTDKPSQVSIQNNNQLIINPANDLDYSSTYYITVEAGAIENTSSIPFSGFSDANTWRFSTISQPISISSYLPIQDASDIDVTTNLELTFNQDIQFNSTGTIKTIKLFEEGNVFAIETFQFVSGITDRDSEVSIQNNNQLIINMTDDLTPSTTYYITIEDGALENTSNIAFSGFSDANTWRFTTASQAPVVITDGYTPASDATDVDVTTNLQLEFDQDIQFNSTASEYTIALYLDGNPFPIETFNFISGSTDKPSQVSIQNNNQLTINPANDLDYSSTYYITVEAGAIENTSSIPFSGFSDANTWRFSIISQPISISSYLPIQDASDIDVTTNLELTFNQDIQFNSTGTIKTIKFFEEGNVFAIETFQFVSGITDRDSEVSIQNNNQLIINMTDDLTPSTTYYITIEDGALENTSNIAFSGFSDANTWRFTTAALIPITTITPSDASTNVNVQTQIIVDFDQYAQLIGGTEIDDTNVSSIITFTQGIGGSDVGYSATINAGKTQIIITPDNDLAAQTQYYIEISAIQNTDGIEQTSSTSSTFTTDKFRYWNGSVSNDVTVDANWDSALPLGTFSAIIPASATTMPVYNTSGDFNTLIIEAGASFTITSGATLDINDLLEINSSNTPSIGNGVLLNQGTLNTSAAEVKIHQNISSEPYDYYISSPVTNATPASIGVNGQAFKFVPDTKWVTMNPTETFNPAEGYVVWSTSGTDLTFSGNINNSTSYAFPCYRTTSPYKNFGWNLIGNPYPCTIDLNDLDISDNMNYHFQLRLNDTGQLGVLNESGYINLNDEHPTYLPSMHAVWVQVNIDYTSGSITIPNTSRRDYNYTYLKSSKATIPFIKLAGKNSNGIKDEALIAFNPDAVEGDGNFDSKKSFMNYNNSIIELYSIKNNTQLAINTISTEDQTQDINLGYYAPSAGTYSIDLVRLSNFEDAEIILEDKLIPSETSLTNAGDSYSFYTTKGNVDNRFVLHVNNTATSISKAKDEQINIYNNHKDIYIEIPDLIDPKVEVYDIAGKSILNKTLNSNSTNNLNISYEGLIIVKIISKEKVFSKKLLIK
nr:Ig-like domain-containing protein [uncultured Carboxylicivirga sp.]